MAPGSMPVAKELLQEGLVIPPIRLVEAGKRNDSVFALIIRNSRAPEERKGDLRAQIAATEVGVQRLISVADRFGTPSLLARFDALLQHGDRVIREIISEIPDGDYAFQDKLEVGENGLKIQLVLSISGDEVMFDFSGTDSETEESSLNAVATDLYAIESAGIDFKKCTPATEVSVLMSNFELAARTAQSSPTERSIPLGIR